jgi:hypothetical protein
MILVKLTYVAPTAFQTLLSKHRNATATFTGAAEEKHDAAAETVVEEKASEKKRLV